MIRNEPTTTAENAMVINWPPVSVHVKHFPKHEIGRILICVSVICVLLHIEIHCIVNVPEPNIRGIEIKFNFFGVTSFRATIE